MGGEYKTLGFVVIAMLYLVIGVMAAIGTIHIFRKILRPKLEQIVYAVFLMSQGVIQNFSAYTDVTTLERARGLGRPVAEGGRQPVARHRDDTVRFAQSAGVRRRRR